MPDILEPIKDKLVVCVSPSANSIKLINSAKGMADDLQAEWFAVYVEDPKMLLLPEAERNRVVDNLRLAEQLGGKTVHLERPRHRRRACQFRPDSGTSPRIVVGKPRRLPLAEHLLQEPGR